MLHLLKTNPIHSIHSWTSRISLTSASLLLLIAVDVVADSHRVKSKKDAVKAELQKQLYSFPKWFEREDIDMTRRVYSPNGVDGWALHRPYNAAIYRAGEDNAVETYHVCGRRLYVEEYELESGDGKAIGFRDIITKVVTYSSRKSLETGVVQRHDRRKGVYAVVAGEVVDDPMERCSRVDRRTWTKDEWTYEVIEYEDAEVEEDDARSTSTGKSSDGRSKKRSKKKRAAQLWYPFGTISSNREKRLDPPPIVPQSEEAQFLFSRVSEEDMAKIAKVAKTLETTLTQDGEVQWLEENFGDDVKVIVPPIGKFNVLNSWQVEEESYGPHSSTKVVRITSAENESTSAELYRMRIIDKAMSRQAVDLAKALAQLNVLNHTFIGRLLACKKSKSSYRIVEKWIPGGNIATLIRTFGRLEEGEARRIAYQTMVALATLHGLDIHYRLSANTVLLRSDGEVCLSILGHEKMLIVRDRPRKKWIEDDWKHFGIFILSMLTGSVFPYANLPTQLELAAHLPESGFTTAPIHVDPESADCCKVSADVRDLLSGLLESRLNSFAKLINHPWWNPIVLGSSMPEGAPSNGLLAPFRPIIYLHTGEHVGYLHGQSGHYSSGYYRKNEQGDYMLETSQGYVARKKEDEPSVLNDRIITDGEAKENDE